jgi:hypothetical protein
MSDFSKDSQGKEPEPPQFGGPDLDAPTVIERKAETPSEPPRAFEINADTDSNWNDDIEIEDEQAKKQRMMTYAALGVAAVALLLAVLSILPKGKISASDIEDGAVVNSKLAEQSVGPQNLTEGAIQNEQEVGPTGATGPQGPRGPEGKASPGAKTFTVVRKTGLIASKTKQVVASCPGNGKVVSGSATVGGEGAAYLRASGPDPNQVRSNAVDSWVAQAAAAPDSTAPWSLSVVLICSNTKGASGSATQEVAPSQPIPGFNDPGFSN